MEEKYSLIGVDGNSFAIMGYVMQAMEAEHCTSDEIDAYLADAKSSNRDHLIAVSIEMCNKLNNKADNEFNPMKENQKFNKMNKRKLYESIMWNVSKQVKKALNEVFIKKDYIHEEVTFNADYLYIGDPCYVISDYYYDKLIGVSNFEEGVIYEGNNVCCITCHTKEGDGKYIGDKTQTDYMVDSGLIGVSNLKYISPLTNILKLEHEDIGKVVNIQSGKCTVIFEYDNGVYVITIYDNKQEIFHDIIDTNSNYEEDEDDCIPIHPSYFDEDDEDDEDDRW